MIELRGISKTYSRGVLHKHATVAVDSLSLTITVGEVFGLLGPNGAGKTTTVKMICGLIRPTSGDILLGADLLSPRRARQRHLIGAVLEGSRNVYWNLTAWENLLYFARLRGLARQDVASRGQALLEQFDLLERRSSLAGTLSRGMQQKLGVCCALITDPPILLVDEPTLGLDITSARTIESMLGSLAKENGKSVLLTTHNMRLAESLCDHVGIIRSGRLLNPETWTRLARRPRVTVQEKDDTILISLDVSSSESAEDSIYAILQILEDTNARLISLKREEPSLEDVFVRMTEEKAP